MGLFRKRKSRATRRAEARALKARAKLDAKLAAKKKKLIVTGFSQGGILSFAMAARHPVEVAHAIPVAGSLAGPAAPPW